MHICAIVVIADRRYYSNPVIAERRPGSVKLLAIKAGTFFLCSPAFFRRDPGPSPQLEDRDQGEPGTAPGM